VQSVIVIFCPSTSKVFFWRLGLKTRFVRRKEKLTLWPNCLPFPVNSHRAVILFLPIIFLQCSHYRGFFTFRQDGMIMANNADIMVVINMDIISIIIIIVVLVFSMTLHEAMHAFTSYWLGDDTAKLEGRLTLNPIKHIDPFLSLFLPIMLALVGAPIFGGAKPVPFNPNNVKWGEWGAAIIALAGPLTNLFIAFVSYGLWSVMVLNNLPFLDQVLSNMVVINLGFFIFNMIPIPPLDGSRVLYALAPDFVRRGMEIMEQFGVMIVFAIVLLAGSAFSVYISNALELFLNIFKLIFGV